MKNEDIGKLVRELVSICIAPRLVIGGLDDARVGEIFTTLAREWTRIADECSGRE
jgi:hypothetical protein